MIACGVPDVLRDNNPEDMAVHMIVWGTAVGTIDEGMLLQMLQVEVIFTSVCRCSVR